MRKLNRFRVIAVLLVLGLVTAACGPSETAEPTATAEPEPTATEMAEEEATEAPAEEPTAEPAPSIVDIAAADEQFSTLVTAVQAAGLAETLSSDGPFTVFAPTNDALAALPEGTLDTLLADPEGQLTDILLYHVVEGEVMAEDVVNMEAAPTLQGSEITISATEDGVVLNENVNVVATDIQASNGVIHVIDAVLLPPEMSEESANEESMDEEMGTIVDIAAADEQFSTLVTAVQEAGLAEALSGEGPFTVFAPTNDAFAALPEGTLDTLLADPEGQLTDILLYHVVEGEVMAADVVELEAAPTLQGGEIAISATENGVVLNENVNVVVTDIQASNGVIHVVDAVLMPQEMGEEMDDEESMDEEMGTIVDIAAADEQFSTLVTAVQEAGLAEALSGEGPFTVFAPTNDAFAALPEGTLDTLLTDPEGQLTDILLYHVVEGEVMAADVVELEAAPTLQGSEIMITATEDGVVLNESINVVVTDIQAANGVIHVIDGVLTPPAE